MFRQCAKFWSRRVLFAAVLAIIAAAACGQQSAIPVDWAAVPSPGDAGPTSPPTGCSCVDSSGSSCSKFDCPCVCDLTPGSCDANCCCDPDCSLDHVDRARTSGQCLEEGPAPPNIRKCIDLDSFDALAEINPKFRMTLDESRDIDNLLCVVVDNNPTAGTFFTDPGVQTGSFDLPEFSFEETARVVPSATSTAAAYLVGEAMRNSEGSLVSLPGPDAGGLCSSATRLAYYQDVDSRSCTESVADLSASCSSLGVSTFTINFATQPFSTESISTELVSVVSDGVKATGALMASSFPATYDAASCTCSNVVLEASYAFGTSSADAIANATLSVVLGNVTNCAASPAVFPRTVSSSFVSSGALASQSTTLPRSGNPGYITGKPVLAGTDIAFGDKSAIAALPDGLTVQGPSVSGQCSASSATQIPVLAGESMTFGCTIQLDLAAFSTACTDWTINPFLGFNATHVGAFGNADPTLIGEWLAVEFLGGAAERHEGILSGSTCADLVTGMNLRFLTTDVGELGNPQRKIVGAQVEFARDTWQFSAASPTTPQTFVVRTTVSFVHLPDGALEEFVPEVPKLLEVSDDLFFPFDLGGGSTSGAPQARALSPVALLAALVLAAWLHRAHP